MSPRNKTLPLEDDRGIPVCAGHGDWARYGYVGGEPIFIKGCPLCARDGFCDGHSTDEGDEPLREIARQQKEHPDPHDWEYLWNSQYRRCKNKGCMRREWNVDDGRGWFAGTPCWIGEIHQLGRKACSVGTETDDAERREARRALSDEEELPYSERILAEGGEFEGDMSPKEIKAGIKSRYFDVLKEAAKFL